MCALYLVEQEKPMIHTTSKMLYVFVHTYSCKGGNYEILTSMKYHSKNKRFQIGQLLHGFLGVGSWATYLKQVAQFPEA